VICNACRYCEGFCAVFPAIELRRTFTNRDLKYLANLCHNCRDCYYACQYAPPHDFAVNVPKTLAELRLETYEEFSWPTVLSKLFRFNTTVISWMTALSVSIVVLLISFLQGSSALLDAHTGENAFYRVVPYLAIVLPFCVLGVFVLTILLKNLWDMWLGTGGRLRDLLNPRAHLQALSDTLRLRYLAGGGYGCNYPEDQFSMIRRWFHQMVLFGFILCLASTSIAAIYEHFIHLHAPYPFLSWPVILGTIGGIAILTGGGGLLYLKLRMDKAPATPRSFGMDVTFLLLLMLINLTGLLLLVLRETEGMGILLSLHLGLVLGLFITLPYGKFVHAVYRYAALVRNAKEQLQASPEES